MKKILVLSFLLIFSISCKAQSALSDSLEKTALNYLEKRKNKNHTADKNLINDDSKTYSIVIRTYSIPNNKYIICLYGFDVKPCLDIAPYVYKVVPYGEETNLYFINDFILPIPLNEENIYFFLTDKECENDRESIWREPIIRMLLLDTKFSIIKEFKALDFKSSQEDILCPKLPLSIQRAYIRKKYGHL